jgi:hypothetical protein
MKPFEHADPKQQETALRAKLRMAFLLLLLFAIHMVEATVTFPFVDHTSAGQNVSYGFLVAAPFYAITSLFILLTRRDLAALLRESRWTGQ